VEGKKRYLDEQEGNITANYRKNISFSLFLITFLCVGGEFQLDIWK
jgi:hypothetical protein